MKFVFIGAGNLATHLSQALKINGYSILQVYSRTEKSARQLAEKLGAEYTNEPAEVTKEADIYVVALKDSAFDEVLSQIEFGNKLVVHCSGSMPLSALEKYAENRGVLYPLQTFSKNRELDFRKIPVFIEAKSAENEKVLLEVAHKISGSVSELSSVKRIYLHIAAVFACNFVNHFYRVASDVLGAENIPFDVLKPLILETAQKVQVLHPKKAQTGPAVRFDENIISKHLKILEGMKNYDELYNTISKRIFETHQNK